jgi:hypothetical protein
MRGRRGSVLRSVLILSVVFVGACAAIFLLARIWIPNVGSAELARPFLGAFAMWAVGIGVAVVLTSFRPFAKDSAGVRAAPGQGSRGAAEAWRSERVVRWVNLAEYWALQVDETGAAMVGERGPMKIVCCDRSLRPLARGMPAEVGYYVEVTGIPRGYGLDRAKLEETQGQQEIGNVFFDSFRSATRSTLMRLLRGGARMEDGELYFEMAKFDEDLFDEVMDMCVDLADTNAVISRLTEYYRHGGSTERQRAFLVAIFSLPLSEASVALAQEKLSDQDLSMRILAATHLRERGTHVLESIVARPNFSMATRLQALAALARQDSERALGIPGAQGMAVRALKSDDEDVVRLAIQALEHIGDREVLPTLVPLINGNDRYRVAGKRAVTAINSR